MAELTVGGVRERLSHFTGDTGGIDSWLTGSAADIVYERLALLPTDPLSCSQLNQLLALSHRPEISEGAFTYYWLSVPQHCYDVTRLPFYHESYCDHDRILTIDQLAWGLYRLYFDSLLFYGTLRSAYRALRGMTLQELDEMYRLRRFPGKRMSHRGPGLPLEAISQDDRYLIAEQACKSFDPPDGSTDLLMVLRGAWIEHENRGGGPVKAKDLLNGAYVLNGFAEKQQQFLFAADELLESEVRSEAELIERYKTVRNTFDHARAAALRNTELYLSMANDLDVYVATSMRSRQQFRNMAQFCETVFGNPLLRHLNLRYFDPTLSAADGHEDKGLIECLMVKCAKVLIYTAGDKDSYGKDVEAAMALSQGKPVIFYCNEESKRQFFSDIHPLSRLIDFHTGVAVGAMATSSIDDIVLLLSRIFDNDMRYELSQPRRGYFRLKESLTGCAVRVQTADRFIRETFANCYHRSPYRS